MVLQSIPAMMIRGGSSKGVFFERSHLPTDEQDELDDILLNMYGSPDSNQIDGIGGGHGKASKAFIVSPSNRESVDLDYTVGQIGIEERVVDWRGNSGNVTHAVGCFGLERGLVHPSKGSSVSLTLYNTNTDVRIEQEIQLTEEGTPKYEGDFQIPGVPNSAAPVRSDFLNPGGAITGELFPTGRRNETLNVPTFGEVEATILDVTNPVVFIDAPTVGLSGSDSLEEINARKEQLSAIRGQAAVEIGFTETFETAKKEAYNTPMLVMVDNRTEYKLVDGNWLKPDEYDLLGRHFNLGRASAAFAMTSAMCTAAASVLEGTVVNRYLSPGATDIIRLGTPSGVLRIRVEKDKERIASTGVTRSARKIMDGEVFYEE